MNMIRYTKKLKDLFTNCTNPRRDVGVSYDVMWSIIYGREVSVKTILKIMNNKNLSLEDCIEYVKD